MPGFGRVGWCGVLLALLLALSCGRAINSDDGAASAGSPAAVGGTGSGGGGGSAMTSGAGPVSGQAGESSEVDCPVTPVAGQWLGIAPDPYGFELFSDGSHLSGEGCLGGLPSQGNAINCSPLAFQADHGRHVAFMWNMAPGKNAIGLPPYSVKMELTLSPERTAMAGKVWTSLGSLDGEGQDIVLVRSRAQPVPPATVCSSGEPSGACFTRPLRFDRIDALRVVELGGGDLLLLWMNQRGDGNRIGSARFDAASGAWQEPEFLDDGSAGVDAPLIAASPQGWAMLAYRQGSVLVSRSYDPELKSWTKQQEFAASDDSSLNAGFETLLVYDGGDATLISSLLAADGSTALATNDYDAKAGRWGKPYLLAVGPDIDAYEAAAASDTARHALVVWVRGGTIGGPFELWSSHRSAAGAWTKAALFYAGDKQIVHPAAALGADGTAIVTWQEWITRIASSSYSFDTDKWSQPLTVTTQQDAQNLGLEFGETGSVLAYFHPEGAVQSDAEQRSELTGGVWGAPQTIPVSGNYGARYSITGGAHDLQVTPLHPRAGQSVPPEFVRPRCEGY